MAFAQAFLVFRPAGSKAMSEIAAGQTLAMHAIATRGVDAAQIGVARITAALAQAFGDFGNNGVKHSHVQTPGKSCGAHHGAPSIQGQRRRLTGTSTRLPARAAG